MSAQHSGEKEPFTEREQEHNPATCEGPVWCPICRSEKAAKATARRAAARKGASHRAR